jgi:eukaryotic-like serine/threonine-protein kinase
MACGKLPFEGESMAQLMYKIANEAPPDIRGFRPDVPDCLVAIIDRALVKDPEQRYQTGGEMAKDLHACLALIGTGAAASATAPAVDIAI